MTVARPISEAPPRRPTALQRARVALVEALSWLACRLPERPLRSLADLAGAAWYRLDPGRAARARRNLGRVTAWLAAHEQGSQIARSAAGNPRELERLVRAAFRHAARYYLEVLRAQTIDRAFIDDRLEVETPDIVEQAFRGGPGVFVGLHLGAIELPAYWASIVAGRNPLAPMETIDDPALQRWFERIRGGAGMRIVGLARARRAALETLREGGIVALIGDRDLTGGGIEVELFGAPAALPAGPALLVLETGAPAFLVTVRRTGGGRYAGSVEPLTMPDEGSRRERVTAFLRAEAAAFERAIARAPEQWWAIFFPIWPDLEARAESPPAAGVDAPTEGRPMAGVEAPAEGQAASTSPPVARAGR